MNFYRPGCRDDWLFVIALALPTVVAGARYFESNRQMIEIAQAQERRALAEAYRHQPEARLRVPSAELGG